MDLAEIVDHYVQQVRSGESVSVDAYVRRYPKLGEELRRALLAAQLMEGLSPQGDDEYRTPVPGESGKAGRIGGYRLLGEIGRGGMGIVYAAEQESLRRRVALKVLPHYFADSPSAVARFEREARAAAALHHTNIVPIFEVGRDGDGVYYAMQLIEGLSLDVVIAALSGSRCDGKERSVGNETVGDRLGCNLEPASLLQGLTYPGIGTQGSTECVPGSDCHHRAVANVGLQVAHALAHAHSRGVIHRDIKPANLLLSVERIVWVTDFGLAKTDADAATRSGDVVGTLRYIAPERFRGACDERADLYALGLTLYELLLLRPAFGIADRWKLIDQICSSTPKAPRSLDPTIPVDLETVILKSIEKDPADRYRSARDMFDDLRRFLEDKPVRARRVSWTEMTWRWARRNRATAAFLASIALLITVLTVGSVVAAFRESRLRQVAEQQRSQIQRNLYFAQMNLAGQAVAEPGGIGAARELLAGWVPAFVGVDLRGWEWYYLHALAHRQRLALEGHTRTVWAVCWSPDSSTLASVANDGTLRIWDSRSGEPRHKLTTNDDRSIQYSPDGRWIATGNFHGDVQIWNASTMRPWKRLTSCIDSEVKTLAWSGDSTKLAAGLKMGGVFVWDVETEELVGHLDEDQGQINEVRWRPNGDEVAVALSTGQIVVWNAASGQRRLEFHAHRTVVESVDWSPDGQQFVSASRDGTMRLWRAHDGSAVRGIANMDAGIEVVRWSRSGTRIATAHNDRTIRIWGTEFGRNLSRQVLRGHTARILDLNWSPDDRELVSAGSDLIVRVWDASAVNRSHVKVGPGFERLLAMDVSHDGEWVAAGLDDGSVVLWNEATAKTLRLKRHGRIPAQESGVMGVDWHPTSTLLAAAGHDGTVTIWNPAEAEPICTWKAHSRRAWAVAWSPRGNRLASVSSDRTVKLWDPDQKSPVRTLDGHRGRVQSVAWQPQGTLLASGDDAGQVIVWDSIFGRKIVELDTGQRSILALSWNPAGTVLASGGANRSAILWDPETWTELKRLTTHTGAVTSLAWNTDKRIPRLASASDNGTVKLWDFTSDRVALTLRGHVGTVSAVRWSRDAKILYSSGWDGSVRVSDASTAFDR